MGAFFNRKFCKPETGRMPCADLLQQLRHEPEILLHRLPLGKEIQGFWAFVPGSEPAYSRASRIDCICNRFRMTGLFLLLVLSSIFVKSLDEMP